MKKKRNLKFKTRDAVAIIISLLLFSTCIYLFLRDINREQKRINETSIARVVSQEKIAERKFSNRAIWSRLKKNTQIYNWDYIRTEPESKTEIVLKNGIKIKLLQNSLVQIYVDREGNYSTLIGTGEISVDTTKSNANFFLLTESGSKLNIQSGAVVELNADSEKADVSVQQGNIEIIDSEGNTKEATENSEVVISKVGKTINKNIDVLTPIPNAKFINFKEQNYKVLFSWNKNNSAIQNVIIEIARDEKFSIGYQKFLPKSNELEYIVTLSNGTYFWKITPLSETDESVLNKINFGKFTIADGSVSKLIAPVNGLHFSEEEIQNAVFLFELPEANSFIIQFSKTSDFKNIEYQSPTNFENFSGIKLTPAIWYWRIENAQIKNHFSKTGFFVVDEPPYIPKQVELVSPNDKSVLNGLQILESSQQFLWQTDEKLKDAKIVISKINSKEKKELYFEKNLFGKKLVEKNIQVNNLAPGKYSWKIVATSADRLAIDKSVIQGLDISSEERIFEVTEIPKLQAPILILPKNKTVFDAEYLRAHDGINFQWTKVEGATRYIFTIEKKVSNKYQTILSKKFDSLTREYFIKDFSILSNGDFKWSVKAQRMSLDGFLMQEGNISENIFSLHVQLPGEIQTKDAGTQYGK